ncbi:MAG: DUF945 domain-containing protein [Deltaproteobacteria bacterium]|nr:DUF945 domain-containing protein [Deltaproteobacteria bacterium]
MIQTATLENVIDQVHQISANHYDETIPLQEMEFDSLNQMWVAGKQVEVVPSAQRLLSNRLRVPFSYLSRCPANLQAENLNYWIEQEAKKRETFFCRFDGSDLRGVFSQRYTVLDNMEILSAMLEHGFSPGQEVQYSLDRNMMVVKVPEWNGAFNVAVKDRLVPGIAFSNSEVGLLCFSVEAFFWRLVCSNGLILAVSAGRSRFKHISRKAFERFPETVAQVIEDSGRRRDQFALSNQTTVTSPLATIDAFNRRFGIGKKEADAVKLAWEAEPANTMFSVINAYTRAARRPDLTAEEAYRLEKTGGLILSTVKH